MQVLANIQSLLYLAIVVVAFVVEIAAFLDSLRYKDEVYRAADKKSKVFWTVLLGIAAVVGFLTLPLGGGMRFPFFLSLLGFVAAAVYFADVRKALRSVDPRFRGR